MLVGSRKEMETTSVLENYDTYMNETEIVLLDARLVRKLEGLSRKAGWSYSSIISKVLDVAERKELFKKVGAQDYE